MATSMKQKQEFFSIELTNGCNDVVLRDDNNIPQVESQTESLLLFIIYILWS